MHSLNFVSSRALMGPPRRALRVVCAAELEPWQERRLKEAFLQNGDRSRRELPIKQLAGDLGMHRSEVIDWYKEYSTITEDTRAADLENVRIAREARLAARAAREAEEAKLEAEGPAAAEEEEAGPRIRTRPIAPAPPKPSTPSLNFGQRIVRGMVGKSRMNKTVELTLESIYGKTKWPSDEIVKSVYDIHRLPRREVLTWFNNRRARDEGKSRRGRGPARVARHGEDGEQGEAESDGGANEGGAWAGGSRWKGEEGAGAEQASGEGEPRRRPRFDRERDASAGPPLAERSERAPRAPREDRGPRGDTERDRPSRSAPRSDGEGRSGDRPRRVTNAANISTNGAFGEGPRREREPRGRRRTSEGGAGAAPAAVRSEAVFGTSQPNLEV